MAKKRNSNDLSSPRSRTERYLAKIAGLSDTMPASPFSRLERYLEAIALMSAGVGSFNGRTGAVVPESGDYTAQMVGALPTYGKGHNLLDNAYFGNADSIIDQRGGYVLTDTATYYTDTALTQDPVTVNAYTKVYFPDVHTNYVGFYLTNDPTGTQYYASRTDCVRGYTGAGYAIDRWALQYDGITMLIKTDRITLINKSEHSVAAYQIISDVPLGVTMTVSGFSVAEVKYSSGNSNDVTAFFDNGFSVNIHNHNTARLMCSPGASFDIFGVGVERGEVQTCFTNLGTEQSPNWVPSSIPDYDLELYKCQRRQFGIKQTNTLVPLSCGYAASDSQVRFLIPTPSPLVKKPVTNLSDALLSTVRIRGNGGNITPTSITVESVSSIGVSLLCNAASGSFTTNETYSIVAGSAILTPFFDANL